MPIAETPEPPYTAVIFTSTRTAEDNGYARMLQRMEVLAAEQPGYLGIESVKDGLAGHGLLLARRVRRSRMEAGCRAPHRAAARARGLVRRLPGAGGHRRA